MFALLLAASVTFTATATGVEKGTAVEFAFVAKGSDRDYEAMFVLDESVDDLCRRIEDAGIPRGKPVDVPLCRLWPVGCSLKIEPSLDKYLETKMPDGLPPPIPIYTGGTRLSDGRCDAGTNMPLSAFSTYSLAQSPIVYNGIFAQGVVYGAVTAREKLKKGDRYSFTLSADGNSMPKALQLTAMSGKAAELIHRIQAESKVGELDVRLGFSPDMSLHEAIAVANAVSVIDSPRVKLNGVDNVFYRSFLPLEKWRDRKERLVQPFEVTLGTPDKIVYIAEDWSGDGPDPQLSVREISFDDTDKYEKNDTCFIYADPTTTVSRLLSTMRKVKSKHVSNWYVFQVE